MWGLYILYTQKLFSTRREIESQLHYRFINSINLFNIFIFNNSTIISKMVIDCTSLHSPHSLETGSKLKYSLLHMLRIDGALPHLLHPPFQVLYDGLWLIPSFMCFNCFSILDVSIKWITMGRFRWPFKFSNEFLCS